MKKNSTVNDASLRKDQKANVLVVDSDEDLLDSFRMLIDSEDCEMIGACSTEEALEKSRGRRIDLLITEFMFKNKSSIELFTLIRKSNPDVPIVVLTQYPELISSNDVRMFGGNQLLAKQLESSRIKTVIQGYCNLLRIMN